MALTPVPPNKVGSPVPGFYAIARPAIRQTDLVNWASGRQQTAGTAGALFDVGSHSAEIQTAQDPKHRYTPVCTPDEVARTFFGACCGSIRRGLSDGL